MKEYNILLTYSISLLLLIMVCLDNKMPGLPIITFIIGIILAKNLND